MLSSLMRNLRWKLSNLLRLGKRRWIVSWSMVFVWIKAFEYCLEEWMNIIGNQGIKALTCMVSRS